MKIIFSPTKTMIYSEIEGTTKPIYNNRAKEIFDDLKAMSQADLKKVWKVNDNYFLKCKEELDNSSFEKTSMALYSYQGLSFSYLNPKELSKEAIEYINKNLVIISGLYGALKPTDAIINYRLEMNYAKKYWDKDLSSYFSTDEVIINLASNEYSKVIHNKKMINVIFYKLKNDKLKQESTESKMMRGIFLRYLAKNNITDTKKMQEFNENGYFYDSSLSDDKNIIFVKKDN